jgi:hypothetical protein
MMAFALDRSEPSRIEIEAQGVLHRISIGVDMIAQLPRATLALRAAETAAPEPKRAYLGSAGQMSKTSCRSPTWSLKGASQ